MRHFAFMATIKRKVTKSLEGFFDLTSAEERYPLSRRTLQTLIYNGQLQAYRVGGKLIVKRDDLERLLTATPVGEDIDRMVKAVAEEVLGK
jgi:excisionase family DNA binding protein